mmetsp:Transcript_57409/g.129428  ORF Transcript_57409/g.129428 Transcript_57409/m.129428 type:complete len:121 (-) Transcript_57409:3075-3437(-)
MLHAKRFTRDNNDQTAWSDITLPPCMIKDTTAETLKTGIDTRLQQVGCEESIGRKVYVLVSDSASPMLRLSRHVAHKLTDREMAIRSRCGMHMLWAALGHMFHLLHDIGFVLRNSAHSQG